MTTEPNPYQRDRAHDCRRDLFGGSGIVRVWSLVDAPKLPFTAVLACELEPGASVGTHVQEYSAELVIGISGTGSVAVNGVGSEFGPGKVVELALGHTLSIANASGQTPLRYLIVKSSA
jgi:uncharacterized cupin superfamily protein